METAVELGAAWSVGMVLTVTVISLTLTGRLTRAIMTVAFTTTAVALSVVFAAPSYRPIFPVVLASIALVLTSATVSYFMAPGLIAQGEKYRRRRKESGR